MIIVLNQYATLAAIQSTLFVMIMAIEKKISFLFGIGMLVLHQRFAFCYLQGDGSYQLVRSRTNHLGQLPHPRVGKY